jgi:hypothetical protein
VSAAREIRELAWLAITVAIGGVALGIAAAALRVAHWANGQRELPVR